MPLCLICLVLKEVYFVDTEIVEGMDERESDSLTLRKNLRNLFVDLAKNTPQPYYREYGIRHVFAISTNILYKFYESL